MKTIYFLILNYNTLEETRECVSSIKKLDTEDFLVKIMIIDNKSEDDSFESLAAEYEDDNSIELIQLERNEGFSRANNYGFCKIRAMENISFIILCNSDVVFVQKDFLIKVTKLYQDQKFHLLGPDVFCPNDIDRPWKGHQSPAYPWEGRRWYVKSQILRFSEKSEGGTSLYGNCLLKSVTLMSRLLMYTFYRNYRRRFHQNVALNGSCMVLAPEFICNEEKVFLPETRFYFEELLLNVRRKRKHYKSVYAPELKIYHMQGRATRKGRDKQTIEKFMAENMVESGKIYLKEISLKF